MDTVQLKDLATYRILIGYLGEREQYGWWQSSFFAPGSDAFLAPLFSRTQLLAQCTGVTRAAQIVHDDRIGIGRVYHLFRLPEDLEQGIHRVVQLPKLQNSLSPVLGNKSSAREVLQIAATGPESPAVGPVRVGSTKDLHDPQSWCLAIGYYLSAFDQDEAIFPYFSDLS